MRTTMRAALAAAGLVGVVGTVIAADLTEDEISRPFPARPSIWNAEQRRWQDAARVCRPRRTAT